MSSITLGDMVERRVQTIDSHFEGTIRYIDISSVDSKLKKIISTTTMDFSEAPSRAKQLVKQGDILVSTVRPNLNAVAVVDIDSNEVLVASTGFTVLRVLDGYSHEFLFQYCQSPAFIDYLVSCATGASYPAVNSTIIRSCLLSDYSYTKQIEISDVLGTVSALISMYREAENQLNGLIKSRFVEMFGDPETNRMGWRVVDLGKVLTTSPQNGLYKPQKCYSNDGSGVPIVRIDSFREAGPDVRALRRLECSQDEVERYGLRAGDVLINRVNSPGNMGKTMGVYDLSEPVVFESNMMRMHPDETVVATRFLVTYMTTPYGKRHFESHAKKAVNQASINQGDVASLPVMLPPLELQQDYLTFVHQVDKSRFAVQRAIEQLETLKASLMQEYFG